MTRTSRVVSRGAAQVVAGITALFIVSGCSSEASERKDMKDAFDTLMKRPSIAVVDAGYQSMFATIRERLTAELGLAAWVPDDEPMSSSSCSGDIANLDGAEQRTYDAGMSPGNLPDAQWQQAVAIVTEVAGQHGFGAPEVVASGPSSHEVSFRDTYHGQLLFGTGGNTILAVFSGCHLDEAAHERGTYLPPKEY